eukprot:gene17560-20005_t
MATLDESKKKEKAFFMPDNAGVKPANSSSSSSSSSEDTTSSALPTSCQQVYVVEQMVSSTFILILLFVYNAIEVCAVSSYWRLRFLSQNPSNWEVYFFEMTYYTSSGTAISGVFSSSLGNDALIGRLTDGSLSRGCSPYRIYFQQYSSPSNRIYSMVLESSNDGISWSAESPTFNTDVQVTNFIIPYPTAQPTR